MGAVIIDRPKALASLKTPRVQPAMSRLSPVAALVLAMHVEGVQVFLAPVKHDLQHRVEVRQGRVTTHE
jgi:hypothetical protein